MKCIGTLLPEQSVVRSDEFKSYRFGIFLLMNLSISTNQMVYGALNVQDELTFHTREVSRNHRQIRLKQAILLFLILDLVNLYS